MWPPSKIVRRIESDTGVTGLFDALARKLSASDLQSLLIEVFQQRASATLSLDLPPLQVPSAVSARDFAAFDQAAFAAAQHFDALDLAPVCPLGASFALGGQSQNNLLSTIRNAEVLGDSTIAMAFEAARLRRQAPGLVRLCASHRVVRLQPVDVPGFTPHFRLFGMVSAGRDIGTERFEAAELQNHVRVYLRLFDHLAEAGWAIASPMVEFADMRVVEAGLARHGVTREEIRANIRAHWLGGTDRFLADRGIDLSAISHTGVLERQVVPALQAEFPAVDFRSNYARLEGLGYYSSFTLRISLLAPDGNYYPVADGGCTDWTARLLNNRKERLLISGIGSEFVCKRFRTPL